MTNDLDRERARFEAWVRREWPIATLDRSELDGDYMVRSLQDHWAGWQAAIAAAQSDESEQAAQPVIPVAHLCQKSHGAIRAGSAFGCCMGINLVRADEVANWHFGSHPSPAETSTKDDWNIGEVRRHPSPAQCAQEQAHEDSRRLMYVVDDMRMVDRYNELGIFGNKGEYTIEDVRKAIDGVIAESNGERR